MTQSVFAPSALSTVWFQGCGLVVALVTLSGQNPGVVSTAHTWMPEEAAFIADMKFNTPAAYTPGPQLYVCAGSLPIVTGVPDALVQWLSASQFAPYVPLP